MAVGQRIFSSHERALLFKLREDYLLRYFSLSDENSSERATSIVHLSASNPHMVALSFGSCCGYYYDSSENSHQLRYRLLFENGFHWTLFQCASNVAALQSLELVIDDSKVKGLKFIANTCRDPSVFTIN